MSLISESIKPTGKVRAMLKDAYTDKIIKITDSDNLVVTAGKQNIADLLIGAVSTSYNFIGVGTSSTAPVVGDTDLGALVNTRQQCNDRFRTGNIAVFSTYFASNQVVNGSLNECGLFTTGSAGTMFSRALFGSQINKTSSTTLTVEWQISIG